MDGSAIVNIVLPIKFVDDDSYQEINLWRNQEDDLVFWEANDDKGNLLKIMESKDQNDSKLSILFKSDRIESMDEDIINSVADRFLQLNISQQIDEADGIEPENDERKHVVDSDPYDPKLIRVEPKNFPIQYICSLIDSQDIDLSPDFQREFVWSDITRKSRLIESLLLRIPIPVFYFVQDEDGRFQVVDGLQRLTVIHDYVNNKFRLKNLEYLSDCEGKYYKRGEDSIDSLYVKRIDQTQLTFNIIDPQTPEQVRYDIFRRINTGGKSLNNQEIRNCLEKPHVRELLRRLSQMDSFKTATRGSIKPTRMADRELVLRFIAFYLMDHGLYGQQPYKGDMDYYLDNTVNLLNKQKNESFDEIVNAFDRSMKNAYAMFGERAFRKASYINKALFLSWCRVLCDREPSEIEDNPKDYSSIVSRQIENNYEYARSLSMSTNDVKHVEYNYIIAKRIISGEIQ